jgi:hypothetical protein
MQYSIYNSGSLCGTHYFNQTQLSIKILLHQTVINLMSKLCFGWKSRWMKAVHQNNGKVTEQVLQD